MEYIVEGVVQKVFPMETVGTNGFNKREIIIRTNDQYPQDLNIQFTQNNCDLLSLYKPGESVKISFNLRGKLDGFTNQQGETKYFNTVQGWKIQRADGQQPASNQSAPPPAAAAPPVSGKEYVHTATFSLADALAKDWTYELLVAGGHGHWKENAPAATSAPAAAPEQDLPF